MSAVETAARLMRERDKARAAAEAMLAALKKCRSAIDGLMIDTDIDGDDNPAMQALQAANKAIAQAKAAGIKVEQ